MSKERKISGKTRKLEKKEYKERMRKKKMENKNSVKIIGIKKAPSSKNPQVVYYTYYFVSQYTDYDIEHAEVYGSPCGSEFTKEDIGCKVGDVVELYYKKGFQDKAELVGCKVLQAATPAK